MSGLPPQKNTHTPTLVMVSEGEPFFFLTATLPQKGGRGKVTLAAMYI